MASPAPTEPGTRGPFQGWVVRSPRGNAARQGGDHAATCGQVRVHQESRLSHAGSGRGHPPGAARRLPGRQDFSATGPGHSLGLLLEPLGVLIQMKLCQGPLSKGQSRGSEKEAGSWGSGGRTRPSEMGRAHPGTAPRKGPVLTRLYQRADSGPASPIPPVGPLSPTLTQSVALGTGAQVATAP